MSGPCAFHGKETGRKRYERLQEASPSPDSLFRRDGVPGLRKVSASEFSRKILSAAGCGTGSSWILKTREFLLQGQHGRKHYISLQHQMTRPITRTLSARSPCRSTLMGEYSGLRLRSTSVPPGSVSTCLIYISSLIPIA